MPEKKMGRPPKDNPRKINLNIRLTQDESALLQECADKLSTSRTEVIVKGVKMVKAQIDKK